LRSRGHSGFSGTRIIFAAHTGDALSGFRPLESNGGTPALTGNSPFNDALSSSRLLLA
jgi:hypothetical protein